MKYRVLKSRPGIPAGTEIELTKADIAEINEKQGRTHVPPSVMDALIGAFSAASLLEVNVDNLKIRARKCGAWSAIRSAQALLAKGLLQVSEKIDIRQMLSVEKNTQDVTVYVSSNPVPQAVNVLEQDAKELCRAARTVCREHCLKLGEEARDCPLRRAMDAVPFQKPGRTGGESLGLEVCPYADVAMEERSDDL